VPFPRTLQHKVSAIVLRYDLRYDLDAVAIKRGFLLLFALAGLSPGHDVITTKVTFNREIVRLFNAHCISCHRDGGAAFSLATYKRARPWAKAIGEEVLHRRMPPWGAVKGFGDFRNDQGLTAEQLELIVDWEEGGAPEGEEKDLPAAPKLSPATALAHRAGEIAVSGDLKLTAPIKLDGLWPGTVRDGDSFQVTAELPDGSVEPLLWLLEFKKSYDHPFLLRRPLELPAGTMIRGVPPGETIALLPAKTTSGPARGHRTARY
jgi:mono/diheme cytochrome c family protein